jgi:murein L,D-transpeptidase YafK
MLRGILLAILILGCGGSQKRVEEARKLKQAGIAARMAELHLPYPPQRVYLRAFKRERTLEVWVAPKRGAYKLFRSYPIAAMSGGLGPKKQEGDRQVPEGRYEIDRYNPQSSFLLSLGLNYPNATDLKRSRSLTPGGDIFIHGSNVSIGCLAMTDDKIREIYLVALDARQKPVRVDIFPMRMEGPAFGQAFAQAPKEWKALWRTLQPVYVSFNGVRDLP